MQEEKYYKILTTILVLQIILRQLNYQELKKQWQQLLVCLLKNMQR